MTFLAGAAIFAAGYWMGRSSSGEAEGRSGEPVETGSRPAIAAAEEEAAHLIPDAKDRVAGVRESTLLEKLLGSGELKERLTPQQIEAYLKQNNNAAESLLAAFESSQDLKFLKQAAEMYPDDPRVMFAVINFDAFPEQRRDWIDRFKEASPNNALADYFSAADYLKQGRKEDAAAAFRNAANKTGFDDFTRHTIQSSEEMYTLAGKSAAEAKAIAGVQTRLPHLQQLRNFGREMVKLEQASRQAGDLAAADEIAALGLQMGRHLSMGEGGTYLINQLVGVATEKMFLNGLDPATENAFLDRPLASLQQELEDQKENIRELAKNVDLSSLSEADVIAYFDRIKLYGEYETMKWFYNRQAGR